MPLDRISKKNLHVVGLDTEDRQINIHATCIQWDRIGENSFAMQWDMKAEKQVSCIVP